MFGTVMLFAHLHKAISGLLNISKVVVGNRYKAHVTDIWFASYTYYCIQVYTVFASKLHYFHYIIRW